MRELVRLVALQLLGGFVVNVVGAVFHRRHARLMEEQNRILRDIRASLAGRHHNL